MTVAALFWGIVFGSVGFAYFLYGKRQAVPVALASGLALILLPYVISNTILLVLVGCALAAIPYFVKL